jgi:hypothetical protein
VLRLKKCYSKKALTDLGYDTPLAFHLIRTGDVYTGDAAVGEAPSACTLEPGIIPDFAAQEPFMSEPAVLPELSAPEPFVIPESAVIPDVDGADDLDVTGAWNSMEPEPPLDAGPSRETDFPGAPPIVNTLYAAPAPDPFILAEQSYPSAEPDSPPKQEEPASSPAVVESWSAPAMPRDGDDGEDIDGWTRISTPGFIFGDPSVSEACANITGALMSVRDDHLLLAIPVSPDEPFPLMAIFCFGTSGVIGGREYIIFKVKDGNLTL